MGGRVYTLESHFREGANVELGADLFDLKHQVIFDLLKEYKLESEEVENLQSRDRQFYFKTKWIKQSQLNQMLEPYYRDWNTLKLKIFSDQDSLAGGMTHPMVVSLDQWLLKDYLLSLRPRLDADLSQLLLSWISVETGTPPDQISALQWILFWDQKNFPQSKFKVIGGNQKLLNSMYERIAGVIPNYLVQMNKPLIEINYQGGFFICSFDTADGIKRMRSKYVVLALPANQLKNINGLDRLNLPQSKKQAIKDFSLGSQQRLVFESKDSAISPSIEKEFYNFGEKFYNKNRELKLWSYKQNIKNKNFIMNSVDFNFRRDMISPQASTEILMNEALNSFGRKFKNIMTGEAVSMDWQKKQWIQGTRFQYEKNQYYLYRGLFNEADYDGCLHFAGDYTHPTEWSHWAGALESGLKVAQKISEIYVKEGMS